MHRSDRARVPRLALSVLLGPLCLLALFAALGGGTRAARLQPTGSNSHETLTSAGAQQTTDVITTYTYLPLVARFTPRPLVNGDFEDGLAGWETGRGPYGGHGSGLPQRAVKFDGGQRALLGKPDAADDHIPVGYGTLAQTFTLNTRYLRLHYWVFSYDIARGEARYYDTFEVSINRAPAEISDAERDSRECDTKTGLNPKGTVTVPGDGLAFCGGRPGTTGESTPWDTGGWQAVALDLNAFQGTDVTLYLTIWSREIDPDYYDDHAWYNTWAYVDHVRLSSSPLSLAALKTDRRAPDDAPPAAGPADRPGNLDGPGPPRR